MTSKSSLTALILSSFPFAATSQCVLHGFDLNFDASCSYSSILSSFEEFFDNPAIKTDDCTNTAEQELKYLFGVADEEIDAFVKDLCKRSVDAFPGLQFEEIPRSGPDFLREYYNGNTIWNEEHQTDYPKEGVDYDHPSNVLRTRNDVNIYGDAGHVDNVYRGEGQYGVIDWPNHLTNFELDKCTTNAAMCCWPADRQADDNNGNCHRPYDSDCEDKDPADNCDLCYVDLEKGHLSTGFEGKGSLIFDGDDNDNTSNAEGSIHCHGLAWANDADDPSSSYKGNNLFYVSMYDHLTQRGYARNVPGAPMCGCTEQMPVASRSDCTQIDAEESFEISFDGSSSWSGKLVKVAIDFNACQGINRNLHNDNNDLWSYMHRLYLEDKVTSEQLHTLSKTLVGDDRNQCKNAIEKHIGLSGLAKGYIHDEDKWVQVIGRDSLKMDNEFGSESFNAVFDDAPNGIVRRVCIDCIETHQDIYYKRITDVITGVENPAAGLDHFWYLTSGHVETNGYRYGVDFEIYSTYEDAVNSDNEWGCTAYNYGAFFPGNCRPDGGSVNNVGTRFYSLSGRSHAAFYVEKASGVDTGISILDSVDIGPVYIPGTARKKDNAIFLAASGRDIWNDFDEFTFMEELATSDVDMVVTVAHVDYKNSWTKAGLMIRETLDPASRFVMLGLTGTNGVSMQWRSRTYPNRSLGHRTLYGNGPLHSAKIRLERRANVFTSYYQGTSGEWIQIETITMDLPETVHIGLCLTSHNWSRLAEATFLDYDYSNYFYPSAAPSLSLAPSIFVLSRDIGNTNLPGSTVISADGTITMRASGHDIWGSSDAFHFMHRSQTNSDFSISVFVESIIHNNSWAKAGVMIRNTLSERSPYIFLMLTGNNGVYLQWRSNHGSNASSGSWCCSGTSSHWVKLEKIGNSYNAYRKASADDEWTLAQTIQLNNLSEPSLEVGLAFTSHNNGFLGTAVFKDYVGPDESGRSGNDLGIRFSKVAFPDGDGGIDLPLDARAFGNDNSELLDVLKDSACPSVTKLDDDEVYLDVRALIQSDFVGGYPSHPSDSKTDEFWAYLDEVIVMQNFRRENNGNNPAIDYMPLPEIWEGYTLNDVSEAVHDEYPNLHQSANLARMLGAGGVTIDNNIMPQRSHKQFLRGPVAISDLNTWATAVVGPHSFATKYHVGRARPEEVAYAIKTRFIEESFVPGYILDKIDDIPNFDFAVNFTGYPEGSPRHPSWPAMHSAASQTSFWMSVVLDLTPDQLCQARLVDWGVAYARTVAGVHYNDDNIQGLNIGQEVIAQLLPIYMKNKYGSDKDKVAEKVAQMRYNWFDFDPANPCPF